MIFLEKAHKTLQINHDELLTSFSSLTIKFTEVTEYNMTLENKMNTITVSKKELETKVEQQTTFIHQLFTERGKLSGDLQILKNYKSQDEDEIIRLREENKSIEKKYKSEVKQLQLTVTQLETDKKRICEELQTKSNFLRDLKKELHHEKQFSSQLMGEKKYDFYKKTESYMGQVITLAETMQTKYFTQLQGLLNNYNEIIECTVKLDNAKINTLSYQTEILNCRAKLQTLETEHAYNADQLILLSKDDSSQMCEENISYNTKCNDLQKKVKEFTQELDQWSKNIENLSNQRFIYLETIKETYETLNKALIDFNNQLLVAANNYQQYKESILADSNEITLTPSTTTSLYSANELARTKRIAETFRKNRLGQNERLSKQIEQDIPNNNSTMSSWSMDVD